MREVWNAILTDGSIASTRANCTLPQNATLRVLGVLWRKFTLVNAFNHRAMCGV